MKISVITVAYNSEATIRDTLSSVLRQTHTDIEYVVVDGASKDGTVDIIREFEPRFGGRLRWVSEPDKGLYDAMNKGVEMATGDVVGILNSDDFYSADDILAQVADAMADATVDAVYGDIHFVHPHDLSKCVRHYSSRHVSLGWMRLGFQLAHPSFYCRKRCYDAYGLYDAEMKNSADFDLLLRFTCIHGIRKKYLPLDMVTMRTGGVSTESFSSRWNALNEQLRSLRRQGVWSCRALLCLKYAYKQMEVYLQRLKTRR